MHHKKNEDEKRGKHAELEFGGGKGALCNMIMMPLTVYMLRQLCNEETCTILRMPKFPRFDEIFKIKPMIIVTVWVCFQMLLYLLPIGPVVFGQALAGGQRLPYRCNGFLAFCISMFGFGALLFCGYDVTYIIDEVPAMITSCFLLSLLLSFYLYFKSQSANIDELSAAGRTGHAVYGFYLGREVNPRIGMLDLKFCFELRPGLIGWVVMDLAYLIKAGQDGGHAPFALIILCGFHILYVMDALYFEESVLTTLDVTTEGFGYMLAFGDITWVPFVFSLQARFLAFHHHEAAWSTASLLAIVLLNMIGYYIFRASNNQKDIFRRNPAHPSVAYLPTIHTPNGRNLLVGGWWGFCRHPNYLGDIIMAVSWCLICGLEHVLPWYYLLYLAGALTHRSGRDDGFCKRKHGEAWNQYCAQVQYKIIPMLF